jgi:hypothetical protein
MDNNSLVKGRLLRGLLKLLNEVNCFFEKEVAVTFQLKEMGKIEIIQGKNST